MIQTIVNRIKNKKLSIAVVGLGYVGLPLVYALTKKGYKVIGIDSDKTKINQLLNSKSYVERVSNIDINKIINKKFFPTRNFAEIANSDIIIYCLPTPLKEKKIPDMSYIKNAFEKSKPFFKNNHIISLESTTYPGTTEDYFIKPLKKMGFKIGENFFVIYSPEREDPGNKDFSIENTTKIISGYSKNCLKIGEEIYKIISNKIYSIDTIKSAEMTKIFENVYRSVNISLVNELKIVCEKMNIDVYEIINAAKTKPFGFSAFYPGPGLGGHCIPIDPFLLSWKAKKMGIKTKFIELSGIINEEMPLFVFNNIKKVLKKIKVKQKDAQILILGAAYKKNIKDMREAPFLKIIKLLKKSNINFKYNDKYIDKILLIKNNINMRSVKINYSSLNKYSLILLITDHDYYNYEKILKYSNHIIDTRGRFKINNKVTRS